MGTPLPSYGPPKFVKSWGIRRFPPGTPQTLGQRKPQNRARFLTVWRGNQREKNHEGFMHTSPNKYPRKRPRNLSKKTAKKRLKKSPKRKTRKNTIKPWGTMPNHLCIPWKVHTRSSFRSIILPSHKISPWSSQASPIEILRIIRRENWKSKWVRVPRVGCHPLTS
jgi:hypothetical protein